MHSVTIFTDGACLGNPGPGGWAALLRCGENEKQLCGGFSHTTNNRMEIYAAIAALEELHTPCLVDLYSDSRYVGDSISKNWLWGWRKKNWKKADGKPVLNQDLWQRIIPQLMRHKVTLHWVAGHSGHAENEKMDNLARGQAQRTNLAPDPGFAG